MVAVVLLAAPTAAAPLEEAEGGTTEAVEPSATREPREGPAIVELTA